MTVSTTVVDFLKERSNGFLLLFTGVSDQQDFALIRTHEWTSYKSQCVGFYLNWLAFYLNVL